MKESFELNAVKDELMNMLTYDCRGAISMLSAILVSANKYGEVSVLDIFEMNHKSIDCSWDQYGWTAEDIINTSTPFISKSEDGKYRVNLNFGLMKRFETVQYYDEINSYPSWLNPKDICNKPIVKKEVLNEKPKEPKKPHEYSITGDANYRIMRQEDGTVGKNDYLSYSIHVDTTNPDVYNEIFAFAESVITEAQEED